ncbi:MAG TPA: glycosyltransferase family 4 protein, partial [Rhodanobacter sp.]
MLGGKLLLIPVIRPWLSADLVVVEHANKNLLNYLLALLSQLRLKRVAYWGHGRDRQADPASRAEGLKRRSLHWADWWFAYTDDAARYVAGQGFDAARITTVHNAIDTRELRAQLAQVSEADRADALRELGWPADARVGVYCGSLYENKRLDWLMQASEQVHAQHPEFRLLIVGGGPQAGQVEAFAATRDWVRCVGPKFGPDKARMLSLAQMWLNPGLVGLGILDAFCAGLPLLTTDVPVHSPEIEYLEPGRSGLITEPSAAAFAAAIEALLDDPARLAAMRAAAEEASRRYSIETMAENFAAGVKRWLGR